MLGRRGQKEDGEKGTSATLLTKAACLDPQPTLERSGRRTVISVLSLSEYTYVRTPGSASSAKMNVSTVITM